MKGIPESAREELWELVIKLLKEKEDMNTKAVIVQTAIAELGPVPDRLAKQVRECLGRKEAGA